MEVGALQQVMGKHLILWKTALQTGQKGLHIKNTLARIGPLVKEVVIDIAGGGAVGVHTPLSGKNPGKLAAAGGVELHPHTGLKQAISRDYHPPPPVHHRPVQGVEHGPCQLPRRPYIEGGIRIQSDDKFCIPQGLSVPGPDMEPGFSALQQTAQLQKRPPLSLPAQPALVGGLKHGFAEKQIEAPAVSFVEGVYGAGGILHPGPALAVHGLGAVRQIGQQAEAQFLPRVPVGQTVALQQGGIFPPALRPGEQTRDDAQSSPFGWNAPLQGHPAHRPGTDNVNRQKVQEIFYHIGDRQQKQHRHHPAMEPKAQEQHQKQGGQDHGGNIPAPLPLP